ncbi:MAG: sucrose-6-phosphate hydrolase, partial [Selenomonadaceae bacterium]|nr:sucrose-6-phosphate hydrolase [Selenomonadaceae bacterium]
MIEINKQEIDAKVKEGIPFTHRWHNRFHLEMPFGLINDPNGLAFHNGEYHIFYQWNPLGCVHKNKSWGHVHTRDFVNYSMPELAMWPTDEHDKDGCYSGCGFVSGGALRVFYTCNAKDENGVRTPAQRLGTLRSNGV